MTAFTRTLTSAFFAVFACQTADALRIPGEGLNYRNRNKGETTDVQNIP
jgi:hypothetical protein